MRKESAGKYRMAKPTTDFPNMMINEHPVWIKVDPT